MSDWYPQAEDAISLCKKWAKGLGPAFKNCDFFLFGSAIYEYGEQFDSLRSDLDIVCTMPPNLDAIERVSLLVQLQKKKVQLEQSMIPALHRDICDEPGVSVVVITQFELKANVHKSSARTFFDKNLFLDLRTGKIKIGFDEAGTQDLPYGRRQALEFCQKIRNEFLALSANDTGGLQPHNGIDPMPKALLRSAAQIVPDTKSGAWYDTRFGLDHLFTTLGRRQEEDKTLGELYKKISIRRGGRGQSEPLDAVDQLLLAEILFDEAIKGETEEVVSWRVVVTGVQWPEDTSKVFDAITRIAPNVKLTGYEPGSVILTLLSPLSAFKLFDYLWQRNLLGQLLGFEVKGVALVQDLLEDAEVPAASRVWTLMHLLHKWSPPLGGEWPGLEDKLFEYLVETFGSSAVLADARIIRNERLNEPGHNFEIDFLLSWQDKSGRDHERLAIEVKRVFSTEDFAQLVSKLIYVRLPLILVLIGEDKVVKKIREQVLQLRKLNSSLHLVTLPTGSHSKRTQ